MTTGPLLSAEDVDSAIAGHPAWIRQGDSITATYRMPTFALGIELVTHAAAAAERANHHPDIDVRWRTVSFRLSTHDAGGITQHDLDLARQIDEAAIRLGWHA
jgi:4a-hydroxytetrahydrobiopterin dehydratase